MTKAKEDSTALAPLEEPLETLVVDDEPAHAEVVAASLERIGARCEIAHSEKEADAAIRRRSFDVVVTDLMLETNDGGLRVLRTVKQESPETEVVLMTAFNGVETAVEAMLEGAFNYLQKPLDLKQLRTIVRKAGDAARLRRDNRRLKERLDEKFGFAGVVGNSPAMLRALKRLKRVAPTDATVLILGDTGVGKELFAQALHQNSLRKNKPFVALNCAALSENLLESEFFGHIKGAFTDATTDRIGKFEYANGGTIFLDEVGDMPTATQVKLLRVLESGEITPVGSNKTLRVDVRLVSATNRDLEEAVENGSFRADLYHRLKVVTLRLPSLKERGEDIPILLDHFIRIFVKKYDKTIKGVARAARRRLLAYDWPGNVRQLRNVAESMVVVDFDGLIDVDDLPDEILDAFPESETPEPDAGTFDPLGSETASATDSPKADVASEKIVKTVSNDAPIAADWLVSPSGVISANSNRDVANRKNAEPSAIPASSDGGRNGRAAESQKAVSTGVSEAEPKTEPSTSSARFLSDVEIAALPPAERPLKSFVGSTLDDLERIFILETLQANGGNREETAKTLGVGERTLYRRLKEFSQPKDD